MLNMGNTAKNQFNLSCEGQMQNPKTSSFKTTKFEQYELWYQDIQICL